MQTIVVLGTGGTIAGVSLPGESGYRAAQLGVGSLLTGVPGLDANGIVCEQVAQVDSKDMDAAVWQALGRRVDHHLSRPEVAGLVVAHGTDTLDETALFLQRVLAPDRPVVLTAAMRPATAPDADGPANLRDAVAVARLAGARGVCVVIGGTVFAADAVRKAHPLRVEGAFDAAGGAVLGQVTNGEARIEGAWPRPKPARPAALQRDPAAWPRVEIVTSHAGADGRVVDALVAFGVEGIVVAGTGNGTVSEPLVRALQRAQAQGVAVRRAGRAAAGPVAPGMVEGLPAAPEATPQQARVGLLLDLLDGLPA